MAARPKASARIVGLGLSLVAALLYGLLLAGRPNLFTAIDNRISDMLFRWRGPEATGGRVLIVDIDDQSLTALGQWPWPRTVLAELVSRLATAGAKVIAFDMVFAEPDRSSPSALLTELKGKIDDRTLAQVKAAGLPDYDQEFGRAVATAPVVLGYVFRMEGVANPQAAQPMPSITLRVRPAGVGFEALDLPRARDVIANTAAIAQAPSEGFLNFFPDPSGTVRTAPLFMTLAAVPFPSLAVESYRLLAEVPEVTLVAASQLHRERRTLLGIEAGGFIPTDMNGRLVINFRGPPRSFPYLPALTALRAPLGDQVRGKVVLIGTSAAGLLDQRATPFASACPGVEVNATIIDNLLAKDPLRHDAYTEAGFTYALVLGGGILLTLVLTSPWAVFGSIVGLLLPPAILALDYQVFFRHQHLAIGVSYPIVALALVLLLVTLINYITEGRQKRFIQHAFAHYLAPQVVTRLVREPRLLQLRGEERQISILFSDIRGFTTLSERMTPAQLGRFMNEYLTAMSSIVMAQQGTVDKFIGDAVMAIWGAPADDEIHAVRAVRAALAMQVELDRLRPGWEAAGYPLIRIGVGINSGPAYVGNFGSQQRFDYTAIGDHVNLASRLEGANKTYGTSVIISEFTRVQTADRFCCRDLDLVRMQGKSLSVRIYEPLCEGEPPAALKAELASHEAALAAYRQRRFAEARAAFAALAASHDHPLYHLYLERCQHYLNSPPPTDWDGVYTFTAK